MLSNTLYFDQDHEGWVRTWGVCLVTQIHDMLPHGQGVPSNSV